MDELRKKINLLENKIFDDDFTVIEGSVPILLSAPHTVKQVRSDGSIKQAEPFTRALAFYLQEKLDCFCIVKNKDTGLDPNRANDDDYKKELVKIINTKNIKLVLDFHGASKDREFDVEIGTLDGVSVDSTVINDLEKIFLKNGISKIEYNNPFKGGGITKRVHTSTNAEAIQIEINRNYRDLNIDNFKKLCDAVEEFIIFYINK